MSAKCVAAMRSWGALIVGVVFSVGAAAADDRYAKCVPVADDLARLACYDLAAGRTPTEAAAKGQWIVRTSANPLDDTTTVIAVLKATEGAGRWGQKQLLFARCLSDTTDVFVNWGEFLGSEGKQVVFRVDAEPAERARWDISSDNKATFVPNPIAFLRRLKDAKRLVLQVTPYNENTRTVVFETEGAAEALKPLAETCHWSLEARAPPSGEDDPPLNCRRTDGKFIAASPSYCKSIGGSRP